MAAALRRGAELSGRAGTGRPSATMVVAGGLDRGPFWAWGQDSRPGPAEVGFIHGRLVDLAVHVSAPIFYREGRVLFEDAGLAVILVVPRIGPVAVIAQVLGRMTLAADEIDGMLEASSSWSLLARPGADPAALRAFARERVPASVTLHLHQDHERR